MKLNWKRKNIGKLILIHEFNHLPGRIKPKKKIKNNQFNIKWFFNRFLVNYYNNSKLNLIENRLDLILFRSNIFLNNVSQIKLNNKQIKNGKIYVKAGDIISIPDGSIKKIKNRNTNNDWWKIKNNYLMQNPRYLEINHNIKQIMVLANPEYKHIPYPINLNKTP
jgi:hypothetical protein